MAPHPVSPDNPLYPLIVTFFRVVNVSPGIINTKNMRLTNGINSKLQIKELSSTIPSRRIGNSQEVAKVILWLNSKEASYINGTTITVNGGR